MQGRTIVITGASAGLGAAAARGLAARGATVAVVGRSPEKTSAVARSIGCEAFTADFGRLSDVRRLADQLLDRYPSIDVLANNAGAQFPKRELSEDGYELTFQINHLVPFLLTGLLRGRLAESSDARVVGTSSAAYVWGRLSLDDPDGTGRRYKALQAYCDSKLANVLFTRELARRSAGTSVTASAFHPGSVDSDFFRQDGLLRTVMNSRLGRATRISPEQGAQPLEHLATVDDPASVNGRYYDRFKPREPRGRAKDAELAAGLWERSAAMVGLKDC